ncbi:hypothetical protein C8R47DRAFT_1067482 [Mycena vitilis]|nr:hypothetical protein C8R47DRAFT_1067482 [Mycena vitilis]
MGTATDGSGFLAPTTLNGSLRKLSAVQRLRDGPVTRPTLRRPHQEQLATEETVKHKMSRYTRDERAAIAKAKEQNDLRRAKARERMALRRARIKALPEEEQREYQEKARQARAKNRRYLQIASWDYRNRKFTELREAYAGSTERTRYEEYVTKSSIRRAKKSRAERAEQKRLEAAQNETDDLPDSSEISTSDSDS